jgi:hypothetical protein
LQILDIKDQTHIAICDMNKEIFVANFVNTKVGNYGGKMHSSTINGLVLLRKGEKFISFSADSIICIWRLMKIYTVPISHIPGTNARL